MELELPTTTQINSQSLHKCFCKWVCDNVISWANTIDINISTQLLLHLIISMFNLQAIIEQYNLDILKYLEFLKCSCIILFCVSAVMDHTRKVARAWGSIIIIIIVHPVIEWNSNVTLYG